MRDVAIISYAQTSYTASERRNEVEMLMPVLAEAREAAGIHKDDIGFTCSGSTDYVAGQSFSFVSAIDALGAWPPIAESHVEMDGAWAMYEAWVKIQCGDADSALAFSFGRPSMGDINKVLSLQLDPYTVGPLGVDAVSMAALQARALLDSGQCSERDMAEVTARSRRDAKANPDAQVKGDVDVDELMRLPYTVAPLREHDSAPASDGAAVIIIAAEELARKLCKNPVWIRGIDHRIEPHHIGVRDLTQSPSAALAAEKAGVGKAKVDIAELHAPFTHQELILSQAMGFDDSVRVNPSGGAMGANTTMVAGLARIGEAARQIWGGHAGRAVAHATSGPCLQQNLVCVLEGE